MNNVFLIARREYLERVRAKSFLIMTVLIPLILGGILYVAILKGASGGAEHIAVVTQDPQFGQDLKDEVGRRESGGNNGSAAPADVVDVIAPEAGTRAQLDGELKKNGLDGYLWVTPPAVAHGRPGFEWVPKAKADFLGQAKLEGAIRATLTREGLARTGMGQGEIEGLLRPVDLDSHAPGGQSGIGAFASVYALFFLMYFVIVLYGMNVARSIIEEKTSRVFEVLLATIRPEEMMAGKVLGVGAVGLTQVALWLGAALLYFEVVLKASGMHFPLSGVQMTFFVVFFVLGYLLYSAVAAALGAMTSSEQELQQLNMILMLPLIACSVVIFRVVTDSNGLLAKAFSFFPFCTPLIMYVRIAVNRPPAWQIALSLVDLVLTTAIVLWFASRIYRVGILMYGKKPNLPEILRWLKYS